MDSNTKYVMYGLGGVAVVGGVAYYMYSTDKMVIAFNKEPKCQMSFSRWLRYKMGDSKWKDGFPCT